MVWITDVSRAAQHLTRLTLESSAQAALITRENELWAYAGQLSREAAQELSQSINRYWDRENDSDLLRFIRLQATEAQHVLYARKLSASMILALVFDGETPFSTIRSQANKLIKNLTETPPDIAPNASGNLPPFLPLTEDPALPSPEEDLLPTFSDLLGEVPPPVPSGRSALPMPWEVPAPNFRSTTDEPVTAPPHQLEAPSNPIPVFSQESSPPIRRDTLRRHIPAMDETLAAKMQEVETLSRPLPAMDETDSLNLPEDLAVTRKQTVKDPSLMETRRQNVAESVTQVAHRILLEPASPAMANLAYACLLVPRFDTHHLIGDAADRLNSWVPQVCIAFGWRLEYIAVRPDYLQWVLRVPPSTAPGYIMRIIRQQTSEKLFADFPRYAKDNPSKDFWAPGYLIMGSSEPHPQKLVRDFIRSTRERQGLGIE
jgi:REP element-mobilizing transposase RayT